MSHPYEGLDGAARSDKPRSSGLTMVVDWGFGTNLQADLIQTVGGAMDFAKVAVGIGRLLAGDVLKAKIDTYLGADIEPFPGGQYLEYAEVEGKAELYLPATVESGYRWVEVSDNLGNVDLAWKTDIIRQAVETFGLKVLGEVGKKEGLEADVSFVDDARACVDAGSEIVLLEAAELVGDDPAIVAEVESVVKAIGIERVMFELPGPWIAGVGPADIHRMRRDLIARYGSEVNIGNVLPEDAMSLEAYRRGLGVNAGQPLDA
jgi:phosphosulfolactate synthase